MRQRLSKRTVDSLTPRARDFVVWDTEITGFGCKVTPAGRKVYVLQYRPRISSRRAAPKRITLGKHGDLTPDQARTLAAQFRVRAASGDDPTAAWSPSECPMVSDLAERFLNQYLPSKKRSPRESTVRFYELLFRCHIVPALGKKHVASVATEDIEQLHSGMRSRPYVANRTLSLMQQALDQAERWGWRPRNSNPAAHVDRYPEQRRGGLKEVMLSPEQMGRLLTAIDAEEAAGANPSACGAIRLAFWTGWRIGEVLGLRWANLDVEIGRAKLIRTKTVQEEYRQIPAEAVAVIVSQPKVAGNPYVFLSPSPEIGPARVLVLARAGARRAACGRSVSAKNRSSAC